MIINFYSNLPISKENYHFFFYHYYLESILFMKGRVQLLGIWEWSYCGYRWLVQKDSWIKAKKLEDHLLSQSSDEGTGIYSSTKTDDKATAIGKLIQWSRWLDIQVLYIGDMSVYEFILSFICLCMFYKYLPVSASGPYIGMCLVLEIQK